MRNPTPAILAIALSLALGACNRHDEPVADTADADAASTPPIPEPAPATDTPATGSLVVGGTEAERFLTDSAGRAVYILEGDDTGTACTTDCLQTWPVVAGSAPVSGVPEVHGELIGTTTRSDGTVQVTYAGHPLYYFAEDTGVGMTNGRDIADKWGRWYLVRPDGETVTASMAPAGSTIADSAPADATDEEPEPQAEKTGY